MREESVAHRVEQSVQEESRACKSRAEHTEKGTHTSVSAAGARRHARSAAEPRGQRERESESERTRGSPSNGAKRVTTPHEPFTRPQAGSRFLRSITRAPTLSTSAAGTSKS